MKDPACTSSTRPRPCRGARRRRGGAGPVAGRVGQGRLISPVTLNLIAPGGLLGQPDPISALQIATTAAGIVVGDGGAIGSGYMLPHESIQISGNSTVLNVTAGAGDVDTRTTGTGAVPPLRPACAGHDTARAAALEGGRGASGAGLSAQRGRPHGLGSVRGAALAGAARTAGLMALLGPPHGGSLRPAPG